MTSKTEKSLKIRWIKGAEKIYNTDQKLINKTGVLTYSYPSLAWTAFLKNIKRQGYLELNPEVIYERLENNEYKKLEDKEFYKKIQDEIKEAIAVVVHLTPDQKENAELKQMIKDQQKILEGLLKGKKVSNGEDLTEDEIALKNARDEYQATAGKKPHHSWTVEQLKEKIAEQ